MVRKFIIFILALFGCVLFNQPGVFAAQASPVVLREPRLVLKPVFLTDFRNEVVESPVDSKLSLRNPAIGSARRKMDEGVLVSTSRSFFERNAGGMGLSASGVDCP